MTGAASNGPSRPYSQGPVSLAVAHDGSSSQHWVETNLWFVTDWPHCCGAVGGYSAWMKGCCKAVVELLRRISHGSTMDVEGTVACKAGGVMAVAEVLAEGGNHNILKVFECDCSPTRVDLR